MNLKTYLKTFLVALLVVGILLGITNAEGRYLWTLFFICYLVESLLKTLDFRGGK